MIEIDTQLMCDFNLMDYSLLFAIEKIPRAFRKRFSQRSQDGKLSSNDVSVVKSIVSNQENKLKPNNSDGK